VSGFSPGLASPIQRGGEIYLVEAAHGVGTGLSIRCSIIDARGGLLCVTADRGRGAVFQFTVPSDPGVTADRSSAKQ
jgi:K+-sensing histidine kinase KdpD